MSVTVGKVKFTEDPDREQSYNIAAGAVAGDAVTLTANGTAGRGADTNPLLGKLNRLEGDAVGNVGTQGRYEYRRTAAAVALGPVLVVVDGAGLVKTGAGGRTCTCIASYSSGGVNYCLLEHY